MRITVHYFEILTHVKCIKNFTKVQYLRDTLRVYKFLLPPIHKHSLEKKLKIYPNMNAIIWVSQMVAKLRE